jgi:uncharacterized protein
VRRKPLDPQHLDLPALCRQGGRLEGRTPLARLTRLAPSLLPLPDDQPAEDEVAWQALASEQTRAGAQPQWLLQLQARVRVGLRCQRCLGTLAETVVVHRVLRFVADEALAAQLDEEAEDEDVLAMPPSLDLVELLEDELILALPLVPRHSVCPQPLPMTAGDLTDSPAQPEDAAPHPFAGLASLRGKLPGAKN